MAEQLAPANLVSELNELYTAFDQIGEQLGASASKPMVIRIFVLRVGRILSSIIARRSSKQRLCIASF